MADPRTGGVTAVQRFGGAINLSVHFHTLVPDGVFNLSGPEPARFVPIQAPSDEEVARVLTNVIRKVSRAGLLHDDRTFAEEDAFAALQAAEVDRQLRFPDPFKHARRSAYLDGFSLHAGVRIHENDREGLERLCRYAVRSPLALHRLFRGPDGRLVYRMKRPRDGSLWLALTPDELLARLATLVPPPRSHALRYHGVFAPNSKHRCRVVPAGAGDEPVQAAPPPDAPSPSAAPGAQPTQAYGPFQLAPPEPPRPGRPSPRYRVPWAELLRKVFAIDVLECPSCAGCLEVIAFIAEAGVAKRILDHLGMDSQAPPLARARAPDDVGAFGDSEPDYASGDPVYDD